MDPKRVAKVVVQGLSPAPNLWAWLQILVLLVLLAGGAALIGWAEGLVPAVVVVAGVLACLFFFTAYRLQGRLDESEKLGNEVLEAIEFLHSREYQIASNRLTLSEILMLLQAPLLRGMDGAHIAMEMRRAMGFSPVEPSNVRVPGEILADLLTADLLDRSYMEPAPGSLSSMRPSIHDLPYERYSLNSLGKGVLKALEVRTRESAGG
jgi:hypothetical protein